MQTHIQKTSEFRQLLKEKVFSNLNNYYPDNFDIYRMDRNNGNTGLVHLLKRTARTSARSLLKGFEWYNSGFFNLVFERMHEMTDSFTFLYDKLEDEESKRLLLEIAAYRVLGNTRIRLPLSNSSYWKGIEALTEMADKEHVIKPGFEDFVLYKFDLGHLGYPIHLYYNSQGIYTDFVLKQYEYNKRGVKIMAMEGDVVIDGGGCWGDTALFFACHTGESGKVYSFEFIPGNIDIFKTNTALNPSLSNIEIVEHPLWSESDKDVYFIDYGPASKIFFEQQEHYSGHTKTLSIDDFMQRNNIDHLDYIKLDIEGAEMQALLGAKNTLLEHRPKLAIALYHDVADFYRIPRYLDELNVGYKFFIDHFTIHHEETILFASVDV